MPYEVCFDLGTGTGGIFRNSPLTPGLRVGVDISMEALSLFDKRCGQPVLCRVEDIPGTFEGGIADLVVANPPYFIEGRGRRSPDPARNRARSGDPLSLFRFIFSGAHLLRGGGTMVVSTREEYAHKVSTGMQAAGFISPEVLAGRGVFAVKALLASPAR